MLTFEWDQDKAQLNIRKHEVTFEEGSTVFKDTLSITIHEDEHSSTYEQRYITIGMSLRGRLQVVVHCDRGQNIRIISVRPATRRERRMYEKLY